MRLIVARVRRIAVSVSVSGLRTGRVLAAREEAIRARLFGVGTQLDVVGGWVAGEGIVDGGVGVVLVATPEETTAATGAVGVVVVGGGAETLLALVVTGVKDLEEDGDKEEATILLAKHQKAKRKEILTFQ